MLRVLVFILLLLPSVISALRSVMDESTPLTETQAKIPAPKGLVLFRDETFWPDLKKNDLLVLLTYKKYGCEHCSETLTMYYNVVAKYMADFPTVRNLVFGTLNIEEEGDLFVQLTEASEENTDEYVGIILICKSEHMIKYRRKPVFVATSVAQTPQDLPPLISRMLGPDVAMTQDIAHLQQETLQAVNNGVIFVVWSEKAKDVFQRLAHTQRYFVKFMSATHLSQSEDAAARKLLNPHDAPIVALISESSNTAAPLASEPFYLGKTIDDFAALQEFVDIMKRRRPGHRYDHIRSYFAEDTFVPPGLCEPKVALGHEVTLTIVGTVVESGVQFLSNITRRFQVENVAKNVQPTFSIAAGVHRGVQGMCVGMHRNIIVPPEFGWGSIGFPPNITGDSMLWYRVVLHKLSEKPEGVGGYTRPEETPQLEL